MCLLSVWLDANSRTAVRVSLGFLHQSSTPDHTTAMYIQSMHFEVSFNQLFSSTFYLLLLDRFLYPQSTSSLAHISRCYAHFMFKLCFWQVSTNAVISKTHVFALPVLEVYKPCISYPLCCRQTAYFWSKEKEDKAKEQQVFDQIFPRWLLHFEEF